MSDKQKRFWGQTQ